MSTQVQLRRGTAEQHASFIGADGELTYDTTNQVPREHDGVTPGGHMLAKAADLAAHEAETVSQVITVNRDLTLAGIQTVSTLANRKIRAILTTGQVHNTKKFTISFTDGIAIGGTYTEESGGKFLNGGSINFSDQSTTIRTRGTIQNIKEGSFDINWVLDGGGATGTATISFLILYHD